MADRYWVGGSGTWDTTNTANWSATDGGTGGASVPAVGGTDNVFFTANSNVGTGSFTVTIGAGVQCRDLTISGLDGPMTLAGTSSISIRGSMSLPATNLTWTQNGGLLFVGTTTYGSNKTITTNGVSIASPVTFNSTLVTSSPTNSLVLQDAFTTTSTITLSAGTLDLNGYTLTGTTFSSSTSNTRSIAYGSTGVIALTGSGSVWVTTTITNFSYTGTSKVQLTYSGAVGTSISPGSATAAQAQNFYITAGTYSFAIGTGSIGTLDFTGFSGTYSQSTNSTTVFGNLTFSSSMNTSTSTGVLTLGSTSGTDTITTNGIVLNLTITLNGSGGTYVLADTFMVNSARTFTFTAGTLNINSQTAILGTLVLLTGTKSILNGILNATTITHTSGNISIGAGYGVTCTGTYTLTAGNVNVYDGVDFTAGAFSSSNSNTRQIYFDAGGRIVLTGSGTVWNNATQTAFSILYFADPGLTQLNPQVVLTYAGSLATTVTAGANAWSLDWKITAGTYTLTLSNNGAFRSLDFTGFSGLMAQGANNNTVLGDITFSSTMTTSTTTGTYIISSDNTITTNGITVAQGFNFNTIGGTFVLGDNFNQSSTAVFALTNGTVNFNNKTYTLGILTFINGTKSYINFGSVLNPPAAITLTSGTLTIGSGSAYLQTAGTFTFTAGTLSIDAGVTFDVGRFVSNNTNTRVINFGAGSKIETTSTGTVVNVTTTTGFSFTGTSQIVVNNPTSTASTITLTGNSTTAMNVSVISGTYTLTLSGGNTFRTLDFTGFAGTLALGTSAHTMWGDLILGSAMATTGTAGTSHFLFGATSGTRTITTNGVTANFGIAMIGTGQTLALGSALVQGSTQVFLYTAGTFDLAGYSTSIGVFTVNTGTHAITNGTVNCATVTHTNGNLAIGTGYNVVCSGAYTFTAGSITMNDGVSLTVGAFSSSNSNGRSVAFGTSGSTITVTGTGVAWNLGTPTNFSYTGTPVVNMTYSGASAMTVTSPLTAISFNFTAGTYTLTITTGAIMQNLNFTGFEGTWAQAATNMTLLGNLTFGADMSANSSGGVLTMTPAASTTRTISTVDPTNIVTFANITINAAAAGSSVQIATSQVVVNNVVLTAGTLDLNNNRLALFSFTSSNTTARTIAYGTTGEIYMFGSGTVWNTSTTTNFSFTGTSKNTLATAVSVACTLNPGALSTTQAMNFNVSGSLITVTTTSGSVFRNLDFTGFTGTWAQAATTITILGNLIFSSGMTTTSTTGTATLGGSDDTLLTGNGHSSNIRLSITKSTGTAKVTLGSAYTQALNTALTLRTGILDTANYNLTIPSFISNTPAGATTRSVVLGSSTITVTGGSWAVDSGLTVTPGTSTITMTSSSSKNFIGGGLSYYNLNQGGSGALVIYDSNSFNDVTASVRPSTVTLDSGTTQTVSNFTLSGTPGNLVTLNSLTPGSPATLSKSSGTVSVNYLSIKDNTATGGATWLASTTYGNVDDGGNSGWNFAAIVAGVITSQFFIFF